MIFDELKDEFTLATQLTQKSEKIRLDFINPDYRI